MYPFYHTIIKTSFLTLFFLCKQVNQKTSFQRKSNMPSATSNNNISKNQYFLPISENIANRLFDEIYDDKFSKNQYPHLTTWLSQTCFTLERLHKLNPRAKSHDLYVMHMIVMTKFALENPYKARTSDFIKYYSSQPESKDYPL